VHTHLPNLGLNRGWIVWDDGLRGGGEERWQVVNSASTNVDGLEWGVGHRDPLGRRLRVHL